MTLNDLRYKIRIKYSFETAKSGQEFNSLVEVAKMALGSEEKDDIKSPESFADAERQFNSMFG